MMVLKITSHLGQWIDGCGDQVFVLGRPQVDGSLQRAGRERAAAARTGQERAQRIKAVREAR
jgi:hypothetical protein